MLRKGGLSLGAYQELGTMLALHGVVFHLFSTTTAEQLQWKPPVCRRGSGDSGSGASSRSCG